MKIIAFNDGGFYIYPNEKERTGAPLSHFVDGDVAVFLDRATGELRAAIPVLDSVRRCSRGWIEQVVRYQSGDHTLTLAGSAFDHRSYTRQHVNLSLLDTSG